MKRFNNAWLPDDESDPAMTHGGEFYQSAKLRAAMEWTKRRRVAVDVGAHCGLWAMQMMKLFERVVAFEPLQRHIECFRQNAEGCELYEAAVGEKAGICGIKTVDGLSGRSYIDGTGDIPMIRLDDCGLSRVDLLKVDAEGYELFILRGGEELLKQWHPTVVVEQKRGHAEKYGLRDGEAVEYLQSLGAKQRAQISGDFIMSWDD